MPTITWSKERSSLPWRHKIVDNSLVLPNVGRQDSGQYICNATNHMGTSEVTIMLEVDSEFNLFIKMVIFNPCLSDACSFYTSKLVFWIIFYFAFQKKMSPKSNKCTWSKIVYNIMTLENIFWNTFIIHLDIY